MYNYSVPCVVKLSGCGRGGGYLKLKHKIRLGAQQCVFLFGLIRTGLDPFSPPACSQELDIFSFIIFFCFLQHVSDYADRYVENLCT